MQSELFSLAHVHDIAEYKLNIPVPAPRLLNHEVSSMTCVDFRVESDYL